MLRAARFILRNLSHQNQAWVFDRLSYLPLINRLQPMASSKWVREQYTVFGRGERRQIFMSIARFAHINRPIEGYYMEFGSHEANTMRLAWDCFKHLFNWTFIAFDSFEGLPKMEDFDRSSIFSPGNLATSEELFTRLVLAHGMPRKRLRTVKGFYDESLTDELRDHLLPTKAATIYVDCDLYKSTVPVLRFVKAFLQVGTVIVFDDWNCFHARPDMGERRAWQEFLEANPELHFEELVSTAEGKAFVCTFLEGEFAPTASDEPLPTHGSI